MQNIIVFVRATDVYRGYSVPDDWSKYLIDEFVDFLEKDTILNLSWKYGPKSFQVVTNKVINDFRINEKSNEISFIPFGESPNQSS